MEVQDLLKQAQEMLVEPSHPKFMTATSNQAAVDAGKQNGSFLVYEPLDQSHSSHMGSSTCDVKSASNTVAFNRQCM